MGLNSSTNATAYMFLISHFDMKRHHLVNAMFALDFLSLARGVRFKSRREVPI